MELTELFINGVNILVEIGTCGLTMISITIAAIALGIALERRK